MASLLQNRENPANISSGGVKSSASFTRPATTPTYSVGDVVGTNPATNLTFDNVSNVVGGCVFITTASLEIDAAAVISGMSNFRLHLFNAAPTAIADDAAFNLIAADRYKYLGYIELPTPSDIGDTLWGETSGINKQIQLATASTTIYGVLTTNGSYAAVASTISKITLNTIGA
jgi:hypothetical protein